MFSMKPVLFTSLAILALALSHVASGTTNDTVTALSARDVTEVTQAQIDSRINLVETVTGKGLAAAADYFSRLRALEMLGADMSAEQVNALLDYVASPDDALLLSEEKKGVNAEKFLKLRVLCALRTQKKHPGEYFTRLAGMLSDPELDKLHFYIALELGAAQFQTSDPALVSIIRDALRKAALESDKDHAGIALSVMIHNYDDFVDWGGIHTNAPWIDKSRVRNPTTADEIFFKERVLTLAANPNGNRHAKYIAIYLCGECGFTEALPHIRAELSTPENESGGANIVYPVIRTLGEIGDETDLPKLKAMLDTPLYKKYHTHIHNAIKRIEVRLEARLETAE
ncbi:MAG: hypothetical protein FWG05_01365 [Kiritimatiellaeota bacterium]|nr:hypothetical protein [Kiritimatiellota bacterium]